MFDGTFATCDEPLLQCGETCWYADFKRLRTPSALQLCGGTFAGVLADMVHRLSPTESIWLDALSWYDWSSVPAGLKLVSSVPDYCWSKPVVSQSKTSLGIYKLRLKAGGRTLLSTRINWLHEGQCVRLKPRKDSIRGIWSIDVMLDEGYRKGSVIGRIRSCDAAPLCSLYNAGAIKFDNCYLRGLSSEIIKGRKLKTRIAELEQELRVAKGGCRDEEAQRLISDLEAKLVEARDTHNAQKDNPWKVKKWT